MATFVVTLSASEGSVAVMTPLSPELSEGSVVMTTPLPPERAASIASGEHPRSVVMTPLPPERGEGAVVA